MQTRKLSEAFREEDAMVTEAPVQEPQVQERPKVRQTLPLVVLRVPSAVEARPLFGDSLLEVAGSQRSRRTWATVLSFIFQCLMLAALLIVPLMFTEALPKTQLLTFLVAPSPPPPPPPPAAPAVVQVVRHVDTNLMDGRLRTPARIPTAVQMIHEDEAPPQLTSGAGIIGGVPGGVPGGQMGGVIGGIISSTANVSLPRIAAPKRVRVSQGVTVGLLIHKVEPAYPLLARQARIQGEVLLAAIISREGTVENLQVISGHPILIPSAIEAVKQWRYRPFLLNGEPVEVETRVAVTFRFAE